MPDDPGVDRAPADGSDGGSLLDDPTSDRRRVARRVGTVRTSRLRVQLREAEPAVTRTLDVPARSTLPEPDRLLQVGMGWEDVHQHELDIGTARYGPGDGFGDAPGYDSGSETAWHDEAEHTLTDIGAR